jgi:hypothetical protein
MTIDPRLHLILAAQPYPVAVCNRQRRASLWVSLAGLGF